MGKILISTAMRVGSTWVGRMVCDILKAGPLPTFIKNKENGENLLYHTEFINLTQDGVYKSHKIKPELYKELLSLVPDLKIINIIRNPDDALYSRFKYVKYHRPCECIRKNIGEHFFQENDDHSINLLLKENSILSSWKKELADFSIECDDSRVLMLCYEKLASSDVSEFNRLIHFLGLETSSHFTQYIIRKHSFENYQKMEKTRHSHRKDSELFYRRGKIGEGLNKFQ